MRAELVDKALYDVWTKTYSISSPVLQYEKYFFESGLLTVATDMMCVLWVLYRKLQRGVDDPCESPREKALDRLSVSKARSNKDNVSVSDSERAPVVETISLSCPTSRRGLRIKSYVLEIIRGSRTVNEFCNNIHAHNRSPP